jgi:DNA invertase Pin-like site-specific DNA recombinase
MLIGYMRVSKIDGSQTTDLQHDALIAASVATDRVYEDRVSGKLDARPGLDAALKALCKDDTLVVWKLDRLGRSLRQLVNTVYDLAVRGIVFKVLSGHGASIDTTTPVGTLVFGYLWLLQSLSGNLYLNEQKLDSLRLMPVEGQGGTL